MYLRGEPHESIRSSPCGMNKGPIFTEKRVQFDQIPNKGEPMVEANGTLIKMEGVKKVFYTDEVETHALEEIHLEIKRGTYISIAGPSGCGKSTLLSILGLLDSPTDGNYWLNGQPVAKLTISERTRIRNREIGFIFQAFNLIGDLTVYENVELPLTYRGTSAAERKQKVQQALERVGMADRKSTRLNTSHANTSYAAFCLKKKKKAPAGFARGQRRLKSERSPR